MKATIQKSELLVHRKHLKTLRIPKKIAEKADVTISISEKFVITGPGFSDILDCKAIQWGTATMPYKTWAHLIENLVPVTKGKEITLSAGNKVFLYGDIRIVNPAIYVAEPEKTSTEIPADVRPIDIVILAMRNDVRIPKESILEKRVKKAVDQVRSEIKRACAPLSKYGVTKEEIVSMVAEKLSFDNEEGLIDILFGSRRW
jgi:hypothetical protein